MMLRIFILTFLLMNILPAELCQAQIQHKETIIGEFLINKCKAGKAEDCMNLGILRQEEGNPKEARLYLEKACTLGLAISCHNKN